jgi:hypothetical protein
VLVHDGIDEGVEVRGPQGKCHAPN